MKSFRGSICIKCQITFVSEHQSLMEKAFTFIIFYFVDILILPVDSGRHMGPPCPSPPSHGRSFKLNHGTFQCTDANVMPRAYAVPFRHPSLSALQNSSDANVPHPPSITSRVSSFRRYHTQFAQIALVVPSRTAFEDMGSRGSGPAGCRLCWPLTGRILSPSCCHRYLAEFLSC